MEGLVQRTKGDFTHMSDSVPGWSSATVDQNAHMWALQQGDHRKVRFLTWFSLSKECVKRQEVDGTRLEVLSVALPCSFHQSNHRTQSGFKERGLLVGGVSKKLWPSKKSDTGKPSA